MKPLPPLIIVSASEECAVQVSSISDIAIVYINNNKWFGYTYSFFHWNIVVCHTIAAQIL